MHIYTNIRCVPSVSSIGLRITQNGESKEISYCFNRTIYSATQHWPDSYDLTQLFLPSIDKVDKTDQIISSISSIFRCQFNWNMKFQSSYSKTNSAIGKDKHRMSSETGDVTDMHAWLKPFIFNVTQTVNAFLSDRKKRDSVPSSWRWTLYTRTVHIFCFSTISWCAWTTFRTSQGGAWFTIGIPTCRLTWIRTRIRLFVGSTSRWYLCGCS